MKEEKNSTIHDVARLANVSIKTVSRILNNDPRVRETNVVKVNKAIKDLDYKIDFNARRLRTKQSYLIAVLYFDYRGNFYSNMVIGGAISACDELGYDVLIRPLKFSGENLMPSVVHMIERSNPDGFILIPPLGENQELLELFNRKNIPIIRISPRDISGNDLVHCDEVTATQKAIQYLISHGHTEIGFISYLVGHAAGSWRYEGYKKALAEAGIEERSELVEQHAYQPNIVEHAARRLLKLPKPPTAIFTINDASASIVYRVASQLNKKIPYDLSVMGFDDDPLAEYLWPPLSTVKQPVTELGYEAAKLLIRKFIQKEDVTEIVKPKCELLIRNSCGPLNT
ncbi:LacI family DNA-binding transcriptional regulator [uncultured Paraglaciecola sp.]|uniref:LacI family DNA-binding transcriptional regulator n=1 Tax=uncultured Paraglaciecola sp. TaxID=1765024 RepID=UPI0030DD76CE|tara:strand:+ start:13834 stop:14859 length:1026 start_codon:yes stop_codon:yes gene_type:complete